MKRQFVTYEIAVALKELGFDEQCLGYYYHENEYTRCNPCIHHNTDFWWGDYDVPAGSLKAPLWQQVVDWFELKHGIIIVEIPIYINVAIGDCKLDSWENNLQKHEEYPTRYKAREAAVLEAIQTIKNAKK